jgi:uncharacterized protein (TIGR03086 family)
MASTAAIDDPRQAHRRAVDEYGARVAAVGDDQWARPTPCTEWHVRDLVGHMVYENRWAVPLLKGVAPSEQAESLGRDLLGSDPKAAWEASAYQAAEAVAATDLDQMVHVSYGDVPARHYISEYATDLTVHAWDLSRAIGADEALDPALVEFAYTHTAPLEDRLKETAMFGEKIEVSPQADTQTKLLAICGRRA